MNIKSQEYITDLIKTAYKSMGHDPEDITQIKPEHGGSWEEALLYRVSRQDGLSATIWRKDIDDGNVLNIKISLTLFEED